MIVPTHRSSHLAVKMRLGILLLVCCAMGGCRKPRIQKNLTGVRVVVSFNPLQTLDQLRFSGTVDASPVFGPELRPDPAQGPLAPDGESLVILFPDALADREVVIRVDGLREGDVKSSGQGAIVLVAEQVVRLEIELGEAAACGNGTIETSAEECDDGNVSDGDGCSATCMIEPGWTCAGEPSVCTELVGCGNGEINPGESCDDGGTQSGDGCDASCQVEPFFSCSGEPSNCVCTVYVDLDPVTLTRDGGAWNSALATVQEGVDAAASQESCEVWVAEGIYYIYETSTADTLALPSGVALYGGFGGTETRRNQRNWVSRATVLDGRQQGNPLNQVEHVVTADGVSDAVLDGFTVRYGASFDAAAGIWSTDSSLTVANCFVNNNTAMGHGGGLYALGGDVQVIDSHFSENNANNGGSLWSTIGNIFISRSIFDTSEAVRGGGVYIGSNASATIQSTWFEFNTASNRGGGLAEEGSVSITVTNSVFVSNAATAEGGGATFRDRPGTVIHCTFYENTAGTGGAIATAQAETTVVNTIAWGNTPNQFDWLSGGSLDVTYSAVQNAYAGEGNISENPVFVDAANGDFHLADSSPCIDAGDGDAAIAQDFDGNPRVDDPNIDNTGVGTPPYVDMGAFEYQP